MIVGFHDATRLTTLRNSAMLDPSHPDTKARCTGDGEYAPISLGSYLYLTCHAALALLLAYLVVTQCARPAGPPLLCAQDMPTTGTKRRSECEGPAVEELPSAIAVEELSSEIAVVELPSEIAVEELPSAIAIEADYSLYCAGEPHPMDVERGEARCSCDRCSRWDRFVRGGDPGGWPRYEVITAELVAGLAAWLRGEPRSRL